MADSMSGDTTSTSALVVDKIIAKLRACKQDEEKFASLLLLTKVLDPSDNVRLEHVCSAVGIPFLRMSRH
jgi:hypothetical protein